MAGVAGDRAISNVAWDGVVGAILFVGVAPVGAGFANELRAMKIFDRYVEIIEI
jgi:hypothetical protein